MVAISSSGRAGSFLQLLGILLIFVFVLVVTYYTTRFVAGYQKVQNNNRNLKILETLKITQNKYVQIIQAGNQYLVIGVGKDEIQLLTTLSEEEVQTLVSQKPAERRSFSDSLHSALEKFKDQLPKRRS
ncbi:MAG: flagellar biosynthetic protein FliO [Lachnospiraceae bacterium]|nr:flagellar biosynthetic protein FliO [Lachnospiraceae bacterium]